MSIFDISLILLKMTNVLVKRFRENQNKHFILDNSFSENCTVYETIGEKYGSGRQATVTM
jgi:hypothetical protein